MLLHVQSLFLYLISPSSIPFVNVVFASTTLPPALGFQASATELASWTALHSGRCVRHNRHGPPLSLSTPVAPSRAGRSAARTGFLKPSKSDHNISSPLLLTRRFAPIFSPSRIHRYKRIQCRRAMMLALEPGSPILPRVGLPLK